MAKEFQNKTDFMLEEYKQIASAFFNLSEQRNKMIQHFITLVALPFGALTAVMALGQSQYQITDLPIMVGLFAGLIGAVGILINAILVQIRFEMITYARTINLVRGYFSEETDGPSIDKYLALPRTDDYPKFNESPRSENWWAKYTGVFFETLFIG
jgi:hypothetical protein